jgi:uroporphyrinogen-III decarboxylase
VKLRKYETDRLACIYLIVANRAQKEYHLVRDSYGALKSKAPELSVLEEARASQSSEKL